MPLKQRNHIESHVLAQAAKWSKKSLRKKYTFKPRKMTVERYVKTSNDPKLQRKYGKYRKNNRFKQKAISKKDDKIHNKFESLNNFSNLKTQNKEFAMNKNKARNAHRLRKLDGLAWESVAIPANDKIFGSRDGLGKECGVGQLQVIDSKQFFANCNLNELDIEEYALDSINKNRNDNNNTYNDKMGLKKELDTNSFNNEANELLKLVQFSLDKNKMNGSNGKQINKSSKRNLKKRKTMKEKAQENKLADMIIKTPNEIDNKLRDLLNINPNPSQTDLKIKAKQKWRQQKSKKIAQLQNHTGAATDTRKPPLKKRKLNVKKHEFRKQIETLHDKQNVAQITKTWNQLLMHKNASPPTANSNSGQLLSHLQPNKSEINANATEAEQNKQALDPLLLRGLADLGFIEPTKIQREVIPVAMAKNGCNDILIAAATGSGKTLCFAIPIINDLLSNLPHLDAHLYALIISPTRELAIQIESHIRSVSKYCSDRVCCGAIIGGMSLLKQSRILRSSPEIIVGTPGRIWKLMHAMESLHLRDLTQLRYLVLDEADRLLSSKHYQEMKDILSVIKTVWNINDYKQQFVNDVDAFLREEDSENDSHLPYRRQSFIVSATLTLESINRFSKTESAAPIFENLALLVPFQQSIKIMDQTPRHRTKDNGSMNEYCIGLDLGDKDAMVTYLLHTFHGKTLIFANTISCVKRIRLILKEIGFKNVYCIHSQQKQNVRLKNLDKFVKNKGANCQLVCTDVCGRGLDIPSIDNVLHFQCPLSAEDYIHRSGRIGRDNISEKKENSFLLMCAEDMHLYNKIILALRRPGGLKKLEVNERLFVEIRRQVSICKKIAGLEYNRKREDRKTAKFERMAASAGIELDELNCRALGIMKTNHNFRNDKASVKRKNSRNNQHKSFEYGIKNKQENHEIDQEINSLRFELKKLRAKSDFKRPKSSYLTKGYVV